MRNQSSLLLFVLLVSFFIIFDGISAVRLQKTKMGLTGGWEPIKDVKDPHVIEIGRFAVTEYNKKSQAGLEFNQVVSGKTQVVAGINYKLVLTAKQKGSENHYEAEVWEKAWLGFRNLTSFKRLTSN